MPYGVIPRYLLGIRLFLCLGLSGTVSICVAEQGEKITLDAICELFPNFRRLRMMRNWGGIVDVTPDRSPIIAKTEVPGLYVNCGWGTGGFKATPGSAHVFAWTIARDQPHPINAPFTLERFRDGCLIDEAAAAAVAH